MNKPYRKVVDPPLEYGFNDLSPSPTRRQRRAHLQKQFRNSLFGVMRSKYIQIVPVAQKDDEGIVKKLGRIFRGEKRKTIFTGKVKYIRHYPKKT